ncbi:hypothetical protein P3S68_011365 [Capsicum galapagoense]
MDLSREYLNGGKEATFLEVCEETHKKKKDNTSEEWIETRAKNAYEGFQKNIEDWRQTQPTSEDSTMVQPSPANMITMWITVVGDLKKGRTYGCGVLQSSSSPSLFPNSSTLQTIEEMEATKKQIVELTQQCAANDVKFAKFVKFEELVKKHMPQVFDDKEGSEPDDN